MNRFQRRIALKKRKPNRSSAIFTTQFILDFQAFDSIERLFIAVRNGELEWSPEGWQLMGITGEKLHVVSALQGWIQFWKALADDQFLPYHDAPLVKFCKSLEYEKPMNLNEVNAAYEVVEIQRRFYRTIPKPAIRRVTEEVRKEIARENEIRELMGVAA